MESILYVLGFFTLRLVIPALVLLAVGEFVHRRSTHALFGGD